MIICSKISTYLMAEYVVKKEARKRGAMEECLLHCQDLRHARWPLSILLDNSIYPSDGSRCIRIPYLEETILQLTPLTFSACQATFWYDLTSQVGFPSGERNHWLARWYEDIFPMYREDIFHIIHQWMGGHTHALVMSIHFRVNKSAKQSTLHLPSVWNSFGCLCVQPFLQGSLITICSHMEAWRVS